MMVTILHNMKIKTKLILIIISVVTIVSTFNGVVFGIIDVKISQAALTANVEIQSQLVSEHCSAPLLFDDMDALQQNIKILRHTPDIIEAVIYNRENEQIAIYQINTEDFHFIDPRQLTPGIFINGNLMVKKPILVSDQQIGELYIIASTANMEQNLRHKFQLILLMLLASVILVYFLAQRMQTSVSRPILKLAGVAHEITEKKDYSIRVTKEVDDEIGILYDGFNSMLNQIHIRDQQRNIAEINLKKSESKLLNAQFISKMGDFTWNLQTDEVSWSKGMCQLLKYDPEESIDYRKVNADIYHPDDMAKVTSWLQKSISSGKKELIPLEYRLVCKDGEIIHVRTNGIIVYEENQAISLLGTCLNITEQKVAEDKQKTLEVQLRQSQKLETVGTMVGGISHELNNILQSMFLYGGLILEDLPDDEELHKNMQHLLQDGERARDIVKQILTFSRKTSVDMQPQAIHELLSKSLILERATLPANIDVKQDIDMNCGLVLCDKTQIHQIIINLCNNAQHAMEEKGGTLTVSLKQTLASIGTDTTEGEVLVLLISDTGHGIDASDLEKVFDPFFTTKQLGKGTGLGLSVIHGIVEMMMGQITVTSEVGIGTTFRILFPVTEKVETNKTYSKPAKQPDDIKKTILLVDDEDSIRITTQTVLTRKGFTVTGASDGKLALNLFKINPDKFDLIVTDQSMPNMSGSELTREVRNSKSDVPIILSTGRLGAEDQKEFRDIGITSFIQKPWTADELIKQIQELDNN